MKYWESQLTVTEAQNLSENGIAILGNPVMRNVIWKTNDPYPLRWITNNYKELKTDQYVTSKGWVPDKPKNTYDET